MTFVKKTRKIAQPLATRLRKRKHKLFLFGGMVFSWFGISLSLYNSVFAQNPTSKNTLGESIDIARVVIISPTIEITLPPTETPTPASTSTPTPTKKPQPISTKAPQPSPTANPKYNAEKIGDTTWRVSNIQNDNSMASPTDVVNALNSYRGEHGKPNLTVDSTLSSFAQERANKFASNNSLDSHAGFRDYMNNGGFEKSGFNSLGENSAMLSGPMNGEKIVKNIFGADSAHDGNQLDNWTHVGVGVNGNAVNVNFGKNKR